MAQGLSVANGSGGFTEVAGPSAPEMKNERLTIAAGTVTLAKVPRGDIAVYQNNSLKVITTDYTVDPSDAKIINFVGVGLTDGTVVDIQYIG